MSKNKYIDESGNIHYLDHELGRGGQGVVYKTKDADTVIKIALSNEQRITDEKEINFFHRKIKRLIFKPLPMDINIAKPLAVLKNEAGYIMILLDGMKPFATLFPSEASKAEEIDIPYFLEELHRKDKRSAFYFAYYLETGGLRKRLYTLSRLAIALCRLHIRGLIYFDISHNNIFINNDDIPLVYLIDADNIEYESINKNILYTPNFEVPEVVKGESNSLYSDIYAFGILSFLTLTTTHPFDGEANGKADWDSEEENIREQWELPWIEDSNDDSNTSKAGLRHTLAITDELSQLFHKLFQDGKKDKFKRPTLPIWIESLEKAATKTIKCLNCKMSYYDDKFNKCPYCDTTKPRRLVVTSYVYKDNEKVKERWQFIKEITDDTKSIELPAYLFKSLDLLKIDNSFLEVIFSNKTRVDLHFVKENEEIYFESKTPMAYSRKRVGLKKIEDGIEIIVKDKISILVKIEIKQ